MKAISILILIIVLTPFANLALAANSDAVFNAMSDEMERSRTQLKMDNQGPPYFISLTVKDVDQFDVGASFGSLVYRRHARNRYLMPVVRVGSRDFDNSNFFGMPDKDYWFRTNLSIDDNYCELRRKLWLSIDDSYKAAISGIEAKQAYLRENQVQDRLNDMTKESPIVSVEPVSPFVIDENKWTNVTESLSKIFTQYPVLQGAKINFVARRVVRWLVNTDGTRIRDYEDKVGFVFWAQTQAADGMAIWDYDMVAAKQVNELPAYDELKERVEKLAQRVTELRSAPIADDYWGPVLFEDQGAAELIAQILAPNLGLANEPIGQSDHENQSTWRNPLRDAKGRAILPKYLTLTDDPLAHDYHGTPLLGGYKIDDDGVPAQKITLVENGMLKEFCQSRVPTRQSSQSNGHSVLGSGVTNILILSSKHTSSPAELKEKLMALGKDAGLKYVLIVRRLINNYDLDEHPSPNNPQSPVTFPPLGHSLELTQPVLAYRLYLDDRREELVRGLEFKPVTLRAFRDIQAVGDDAKAYLSQPGDLAPRHLVVPSILVGELELYPPPREHTSIPKLPSPLMESAKH